MHCPYGTAEECLWMARVFLLYLLEAYLFANGRQMVSLRWLALFRDFERSLVTNWGRYAWPTSTPPWILSVGGHCAS